MISTQPTTTKKVAKFVKAPPWLYRPASESSPGFTDREVRAYLGLREHQRENGSAKGTIPSEKTVAEIVGYSERSSVVLCRT